MRVARDKALGSLPRVYVKPGGGEREWKRILAETLEETDETCMLCEDAITSNQVALR